MNSKSIFASKTFWLNVLGTAASFSSYFPPKYSIFIMAGLNILNRFLTVNPVTIMGTTVSGD